MRNYLFLGVFFFFLSCKKDLKKELIEQGGVVVDTLKTIPEIEPKIDTVFEYRENSLKMIVQKGSVVLNDRTYLLSKENKYDSLGGKIEYNEYDEPGTYGMKWLLLYDDGSLKEKGQLVKVLSGYLKGGEHLHYTVDGDVDKKAIYTYDTKANTYHLTIIKVKLIEYYLNKTVKSVRFYEGGYDFSIDLSKKRYDGKNGFYKDYAVGTWKFYDEKGRLTRIEKY